MPQSVSGESFFGRFSSSARSSIASKDHKATVQLLDDSETIQCEYKKNDTGQALLDYVCDYLNVVEKDYFGLRYQDANKHRYWLDTTKQITRQVRGMFALDAFSLYDALGAASHVSQLCSISAVDSRRRSSPNLAFRLRIRFYPADPSVIKEEITRYQLFLQLRRDLLHGRLYCPQNEAAALGAYIIQSELGDYDPTEHKEGYVSEYKLFLKQTSKLEEKIAIAHQGLRGLTPADAELQFLKKASQFDTYGFDPHTVKDAKQGSVYIGVTHQGILVYQANRKVHHIKWNDLDKVDYLGKEFRVYPKASYFNDDLAPPVDANEKTLN
uniref:Moesin/ezrin/radixin homolog 1 n=1 Tax=Plectus sambesii TaxID=2011161 RepID=A0A914UNJ6_9BILA